MPMPWVTYLRFSCIAAATAERDHRPISQHKVAGSVAACAAQQQQLLKPRLSLSRRRASGHCIVRSVVVFVAGRALDGPVVRRAVCVRAQSAINPEGSSSQAASMLIIIYKNRKHHQPGHAAVIIPVNLCQLLSPINSWTILLGQVFASCVSLLTTTSEFRLRRRRYRTTQRLCYLHHISTTHCPN